MVTGDLIHTTATHSAAERRTRLQYRHRASLLAIALLTTAWAPYTAAAPMATADAYDLSVNVSVLGGVQSLNVPPQAHTNVPAQAAAFHQSQNGGPLNIGSDPVAPLITLTTGNMSAEVQWSPPTSSKDYLVAGAQATANNVALNAGNVVGGTNLLNLTALLLRATALVSGHCPAGAKPANIGTDSFVDDIWADNVWGNGFDNENLGGNGDSDQSGLTVGAGGGSFTVPTDPGANTTLSIPGVGTLILNEQTAGGDRITNASKTTNALHLSVNVPAVITAEVIIAHAFVGVTCN